MKPYGHELVLDLSNCSTEKFNRKDITEFFEELCSLIDMEREDLYFWDYEGVTEEEIPYDQPHLMGISAVQFITTSNITIHTLNLLQKIFVNIFSCKEFNEKKAEVFTKKYFSAGNITSRFLVRE